MAISTLTELKTEVTNYTKRADLSPYLDNIVLVGERWIFRKARTRHMEQALSVAISGGVAAVPADFVALKNARISGQTRALGISPAEWIYSEFPTRSGGAMPAYIGVEGSNFVFGPYPNDQTIVGTYYKRLTSLLSGVTTFFTDNPDLYLYATLAATESFLKNDPRIGTWIALRDGILTDVNQEDQAGHFGDGLAATVA